MKTRVRRLWQMQDVAQKLSRPTKVSATCRKTILRVLRSVKVWKFATTVWRQQQEEFPRPRASTSTECGSNNLNFPRCCVTKKHSNHINVQALIWLAIGCNKKLMS